jgi:hypothetical protein
MVIIFNKVHQVPLDLVIDYSKGFIGIPILTILTEVLAVVYLLHSQCQCNQLALSQMAKPLP